MLHQSGYQKAPIKFFLSMRGISSCFSPNTRIKNGQKGSGNLDEANASHTENGLYRRSSCLKNLEAYKAAAANPTIFPMTPLPRTSKTTLLVHLLSSRKSSIWALPSRLFEVFPGEITELRSLGWVPDIFGSCGAAWKSRSDALRCNLAIALTVMRM